MKNLNKIILTILTLGLVNSCETLELDALENPTQVSQNQLNPQNIFDNIQVSFGGFVSQVAGFSSFTSEVTRQFTMQGSSVYQNAYAPINFDGIWSTAYAGVLKDISTLESIDNPENFEYQIGASKVMKAYVLFTLVDLFGDVPLEEALQGETNELPVRTDQIEVYLAAIDELNQARTLLASGRGILPLNDLFFGASDASLTKWIAVANSLELRALNNARNAGSELGINIPSRLTTLLNSDLIDSIDEDFQFNYAPNRLNPDARHPAYSINYEATAAGYLANYLMWEMTAEKGFDDPRLRYYFYRQDTNATNEDIFTLGCAVQSAPGHYAGVTSLFNNTVVPFCTADAARGYWGRDHGDNNGIPPDVNKRTLWGVYPAGGLFDTSQAGDVQNEGTDGLLGDGIEPILLSSHVAFIKAEIAQTLGIGNAAQSLEDAIRFSMEKVLNFGSLDPATVVSATAGTTYEDFFPTPGEVDGYVGFVLDAFTAGDINPLDLIMKELHIASFGNGLEVYNAYRRTGLPSNMQPSLNPNAGNFYRRAFYPANSINNNTNANQAEITEQIFWDKNPANFIN